MTNLVCGIGGEISEKTYNLLDILVGNMMGCKFPLPENWREVRISLDEKGPYFDPKSAMSVPCCPKCKVRGEPDLN